jgi:hypothetical protein
MMSRGWWLGYAGKSGGGSWVGGNSCEEVYEEEEMG